VMKTPEKWIAAVFIALLSGLSLHPVISTMNNKLAKFLTQFYLNLIKNGHR